MAAEQEGLKGGGGAGGGGGGNNSSSSGRNRGGVQRVEGKLRASVEKGDYYEAHQMYRTLFFRSHILLFILPTSMRNWYVADTVLMDIRFDPTKLFAPETWARRYPNKNAKWERPGYFKDLRNTSDRYMSQGKHVEARELMYSGALLFFSHNQQNSAADLSMLVLESLEKSDAKVTDELLDSHTFTAQLGCALSAQNLAKVFSLMDPNSPERVAFVSRALKWSSGGSGKLGHPKLHQLLAITLWKEQNYCESRYHFLHSTDGEGCANMLVEYSSSRGYRSEADMFVAQAVLQFLCLKNKTSALVVFTTYTQKHPSIERGPPFVQPLLNFIWFLLLAVDGGKLTVFTVLCEQYQPSLKRDPMYNEYLDRIGQLFFGVPPKQTSSYGGLLGNLLNSLMVAGEEEDAEDGQEDSSPIELD
ncbi:UNVERIFIED_CONTAM: Golgi to ER traffic protein 4 [Gekko kuhli]